MSKKLLVAILAFGVIGAGFLICGPVQAFATFSSQYQISFTGANANPDADLDAAGNVYVVYERGGSIYYKMNRGTEQLVAVGASPDLAIDSAGNAHVAYLSGSDVMYTKLTGSAWSAPAIVAAGNYATIDTDSSNNAYIAYSVLDGGYSDIYYSLNAAAGTIVLDGQNEGGLDKNYTNPVIKIDGNDNYHIACLYTAYVGDPLTDAQYVKVITNAAAGNSLSEDLGYGTAGALSRNSLAIDGANSAYVIYKNGIANRVYYAIITIDGSWNKVKAALAVSNAGIAINGSTIGWIFDSLGKITYFGRDPIMKTGAFSGANPVVLLGSGSHYVYHEKSDGNIWLATDQTIADSNPSVVSGVVEGGLYNIAKTITFTDDEAEPAATLDGAAFASGDMVSADGAHVLVVMDGTAANDITIHFTIDTIAPTVTGLTEGATYTSAITGITFSDGTALLAGPSESAPTSPFDVSTNGAWTLTVTDLAGNKTIINFTVAIPAPVTPPATTGGGGGGSATTYCSSVVYGDWQSACLNGTQLRNVLTRIPGGCALTPAQQLEQRKSCSVTATTTPQVTPTPQVLGATYCGDFKNGDLIRNLAEKKIYVLINSLKSHITTLLELQKKYAGKKINNVGAEVIACYPNYTGQVLGAEYSGKFSDGSLIRNKVNMHIYVVKGGKKLYISSLDELRAHYAGLKINNLTPAEVDLYPNY